MDSEEGIDDRKQRRLKLGRKGERVISVTPALHLVICVRPRVTEAERMDVTRHVLAGCLHARASHASA